MGEQRVSDERLAEMVRYGDGVGAELHPLALDLRDARAEVGRLLMVLTAISDAGCSAVLSVDRPCGVCPACAAMLAMGVRNHD